MTKRLRYSPQSTDDSQQKEVRSSQTLSPEEAFAKLQKFCAYQERSIFDAKEKLRKLKVAPNQLNSIIYKLQEEGFLNEKRYASSFVAGKFKHNKWVKIKIRYELIKKKIPESIISRALSEINDIEYNKTIEVVVLKKLKEFSQPINLQDKNKLFRYLTSKGFEFNIIEKVLDI